MQKFNFISVALLGAILSAGSGLYAIDFGGLDKPDQSLPIPPKAAIPRQVVFLCDASESMQPLMPALKEQLGFAVDGLRPVQSFNIIFYQDDKLVSFDAGLVPASPEAKRNAAAWVNGVTAKGKSDPIRAVEAALSLKPKVIYLLVGNAAIPNAKGMTETINRMNKDAKAEVNTILFVKDGAARKKNDQIEPLLKKIAEENAGKFTCTEADSLQDPNAPANKGAPQTQPAPARPPER